MGCAESRNTVQPQGGGSGTFAGGTFAAVTPGVEQQPKKPKHKPNTLLPEPEASAGSTLSPRSSSSPSIEAIANAKVAAAAALTLPTPAHASSAVAVAPSPLASGPTLNLLPPGNKQSLQHLTLEALSIEFLKAVKTGDLASMERVVQQAARAGHPPLTNIRGMWESTPLLYACQYCHPSAAMWLLERGADVHVENEKGVTPLLLASLEGMTDVVDRILLTQPTTRRGPAAAPVVALPASASGADAVVHVDKQVAVVYNSSADVNARVNPLLAASMNGHAAIVAKLLAHGAGVNVAVSASAAVATAKQFALLLAAKFGHAGVVRLLIKHGADFATSDASGNHALLLACEAGKDECALELLCLLPATHASAYMACWKQPNCHGLTALHFAAANGLLSVVQSMLVRLEWGADRAFLNATSANRRECALLMACRKRQNEVAQLLVRCGADFELADRGGTTALQVLTREKKDTLVQLCESQRAARSASGVVGSDTVAASATASGGAETTEVGARAASDTTELAFGMVEAVGAPQHDKGAASGTDGSRGPSVEGGAKRVVTAATFDWDADSALADAPPQTPSSVIDRLASVVGGALRSISFSRTPVSGNLEQQEQQQQQQVLRALDEASAQLTTTVAPTAIEESGIEDDETHEPTDGPVLEPSRTANDEVGGLFVASSGNDASEAPRPGVDTTLGVDKSAEAAGDSSGDATMKATTHEPTRVADSEASGETDADCDIVVNTTATAAPEPTTAAPSESDDASPQASPSRKTSKPKHRKKEQASPPRRPRQKKSTAKDPDDARATSPASVVDAVASAGGVVDTVVDETATDVDATPPSSSSSGAVDKFEDAPSPKKERRKRKKQQHHTSKKNKHSGDTVDGHERPGAREDEDASGSVPVPTEATGEEHDS
ncbi:hypothetical protein PybrP1_002929 [[Pythium] brassicae (nom. inval.)]|nr:hypothetical protein PybrP1_002929 [[Pythium] brassicae (nom. inval.)]